MAFEIDEAQAFIQRVDDTIVSRGDGQWQVDPADLRALARENSELYILACRSWVFRAEQGGPKQRGNAQAAMVLASAYTAEYGDDALETVIRDELTSKGIEAPLPRVTTIDGESPRPEEHPLRVLQVDSDTLRQQDIYAFVKLFGHPNAEDDQRREQMRDLRSACAFTFPVPVADPREVWEVPEVREFVKLLNTSLPYLPYFLGRRTDFNALQVWWLCLAPEEALVDGVGLDLNNQRLAAQLGYTAYITEVFAQLLGDDTHDLRRELLIEFPEEYAAQIWELADSLAADDDDD